MHHAATGLSMPPDSKFSARPLVPTGRPARSLDLGAVDIGGVVANFHHDLQLRVMHVDAQMMVLVQQVGTSSRQISGLFIG